MHTMQCTGALMPTGDVVQFLVEGVKCARHFEHGLRSYPIAVIDGVECVAVVLDSKAVDAFDDRTKATLGVGTPVRAKGVMGKCGVRFVEWRPPCQPGRAAAAAVALLRRLNHKGIVMKYFSVDHLADDGQVVLAQQNVAGADYEPPTVRPLPIAGDDRAAAAQVAVASQALARQCGTPLWPFRAKRDGFELILRGRDATHKPGLEYDANYHWMLEKLLHDKPPEYDFNDTHKLVDSLFRDAAASKKTYRDLLQVYDKARDKARRPGPRTTLMRIVQAHKAGTPFVLKTAPAKQNPRRERA